MAKRKKKSDTKDIVRLCAYFALVIAAATFLFSGIVAWFNIGITSVIMSIVDVVGKVCLVIGIAFPAYDFTRSKGVAWRIIYWIALIVYVAGCVFGFLPKIG